MNKERIINEIRYQINSCQKTIEKFHVALAKGDFTCTIRWHSENAVMADMIRYDLAQVLTLVESCQSDEHIVAELSKSRERMINFLTGQGFGGGVGPWQPSSNSMAVNMIAVCEANAAREKITLLSKLIAFIKDGTGLFPPNSSQLNALDDHRDEKWYIG